MKFARMLKCATAAAALLIAAGTAHAQGPQNLRLMTGPQGGSWVPLGGALKGMWEKAIPGATVQTLPGAGISNIKGVNEGKAEIGFGNSISTVDAVNGQAPFTEKQAKVCNIATLYPQYFHVVALQNANINSGKDLKGKTLIVQPRGNTAEQVTQHYLKANGLSYDDMRKVNYIAAYTDAVSMMQDGNADVFTLGTTAPASAVMDLASARDVKLVGVDDATIAAMKKINPGYTAVTIKGGTYPKQDKDTKVIGYATHLIVACSLPEDTVYQMVKTIAANAKDLTAVTSAISGLTPKVMSEDIGVPMHPGATKFYKEQGVL